MTQAGSCRRCRTPLEASDLRCSICALAVPTDSNPALSALAAMPRATILRCRECAAAVAYSAEARAPRCSFCGAVMEIEHPADPIEEAEWLVPFTVARDAANRSLRSWLGSRGFFRPADLSTSAAVESMKPLHWAAWIFEADAQISWAADSDQDSQRSDWAPHAGSTTFQWRGILVPASRGLRDRETARLTPGYALDRAVAIAAAGPIEDGVIETFDVQRSAARRRIVDTIEAMATQDLVAQGHVPGRRVRNVHASVLLSGLHTRRIVLPAWVLAYRYGGAVYRTIVHGQDESIVLGEAPVSWTKVAMVVAAVAAVALAVALLLAR